MFLKIFFSFFLFFTLGIAAPANTNNKSTNKNLWKQWYTFTKEGKASGYYLEEAEVRPKQQQISISQHWWEKSESGIDEIYIGSVSKSDQQFSPVAFFVERKKLNANYNIDGRAKAGTLTVKTKKNLLTNDTQLNPLEPKDIFSNFLPMLLANSRKQKKMGSLSYRAVLEDGANSTYQPEQGVANWKSESKKFSGESCYLFENKFQNLESQWWITDAGKICVVLIPNLGAELKLASEKEALRFLGNQ